MSDRIDTRPAPGISTTRKHDIDWRRAVEKVVWVPAACRAASVSAADARRTLRCTEASFARLVDLGLPAVDGPDGPLYDPHDVKNVGLFSRSGVTDVELSMRIMLSFMQSGRDDLVRPRRWRYRLQLLTSTPPGARLLRRVYRPMPELYGGTLDSWAAPTGAPPEVTGPYFRMAQGSEVTGTLTTRGRQQVVRSPAIRQMATELLDSGVRWQYLPEALAADPYQAFSLGVGNCGTLGAVLRQRLADAGFEVNAYHGWMIALSEVGHGWVEVLDEDGGWKWLDPSFALLGRPDAFGSDDFVDFLMGSTLNRVVPTQAALNGPLYDGDGRDTGDKVSFLCRADETATATDDGRSRMLPWRRRRAG